MTYQRVLELAGTAKGRSDQYKAITHDVEATIRRLAPRDRAWTLGEAGTTPLALHLAAHGSSPPGIEDTEEANA
jgi:hypothetical protein